MVNIKWAREKPLKENITDEREIARRKCAYHRLCAVTIPSGAELKDNGRTTERQNDQLQCVYILVNE